MNKINCRIISINTNNEDEFESVQLIGTAKDDTGKKLRYKQRRENIQNFLNVFNNQFVDIQFMDAVTPKSFTEDLTKDWLSGSVIFEGKKFELSKELWICYIGNFLSHYSIWNMDEDTLVLEDDVLLDHGFFETIPNLIESFKKINQENKLLYLQVSAPWSEDAMEKNFNLVPVNENISKFFGGDISGTAAYFITKECKKIILNNLRPISPCDNYLDILQKMSVINYYLPSEKSLMCKLDTKTFLL
jgi:hypothetical protein